MLSWKVMLTYDKPCQVMSNNVTFCACTVDLGPRDGRRQAAAADDFAGALGHLKEEALLGGRHRL